jgi:DNA anti-recombination protein RmuC
MYPRIALTAKFVAACVAVFLLAGCEDPEARQAAEAAKSKMDALNDRIDRLEQKLQEAVNSTAGQVASAKEHFNAKAKEMNEALIDAKAEMEKKANTSTSEAFQNLLKQHQALEANMTERIQSVESNSLSRVQKELETQIDAAKDFMRGYMDHQLKDLYPYAYQPRRMEPTEAPKEPQE